MTSTLTELRTTDPPTCSVAPSQEAAVLCRLLGRGRRRRARADRCLPVGRGGHPHHRRPRRQLCPPGRPWRDHRVGDRPRHHGHLPRGARPRWPATPQQPTAGSQQPQWDPATRTIVTTITTPPRPDLETLGLQVSGPSGAVLPVATYGPAPATTLSPGEPAGRERPSRPPPRGVPGVGRQGHRGRGHLAVGEDIARGVVRDHAGRARPGADDGVVGGAAGRCHLPGLGPERLGDGLRRRPAKPPTVDRPAPTAGRSRAEPC